MIGNLVRGSGFRGVVSYVLSGRTPEGRPRSTLIASNMAGRTARELACEFKAFRHLRPTLGKAVFHASLSLSPQDRPLTDAEFADLARRYLDGMGFAGCPFLAVKHSDTDHQHIHLIASRITPRGEVVSDKQDYKRSEALIRRLEAEFGLGSVAPSSPRTPRRPTMKRSTRQKIEAHVEEATANAAPMNGCTAFSPTDTDRRDFRRRLLEDEYQREVTACLSGDCAFVKRVRYGLLIHTRDGGLIVDKGDAITAKQMTDEAAASRIIALAVAKGWCGIELSGSRDFVRHAMRQAIRSGLAVHPKDADQRLIHEEVLREIGRGGDSEHEIGEPPSFAQRLAERRRQSQMPPPPTRRTLGGL